MDSATAGRLQFDPPGPGSWEIDAVHFPRPVTRYFTEMHQEPFQRGFRELTRFYGMLIDTIAYAFIDGFVYRTVLPAPESEIPARFQRAEEVFAHKLWREQLHEWDEVFKPSSIRTHRELQAVDTDALTDGAAVKRMCW